MTTQDGFIYINSVSKLFGSLRAVDDISFTIREGEFFSLLGGSPAIGRSFLPDEFGAGGAKTVILSHAFWQRRFGGDTRVIGKSIHLNDDLFTVVGVMPRDFQFPFRAAFWTPLDEGETSPLYADRFANLFGVVALLKPGVSAVRAEGEIASLAERSARESRAGQHDHDEIRDALKRLLDLIDEGAKD